MNLQMEITGTQVKDKQRGSKDFCFDENNQTEAV